MDKLIAILKKWFWNPKNLLPVNTANFSLGAFVNEVDNRDIPYAAVAPQNTQFPSKIVLPNFLKIPRFNQGPLGTCVPHAFEFVKRIVDNTTHSRRIPYVMTRDFLGWSELNGQGLPQREAAKIFTTVGDSSDGTQDNSSLPHNIYTALTITEDMIKNANRFRFGGFSFPTISVNSFKNALVNGHAIIITVAIDFSAIDTDGTIRPRKNRLDGYHEIVIGSYDDSIGKFQFANWWGSSWGTNGNGYIRYDELEKIVYDAIVVSDIPEDMKDRAKLSPYIFVDTLSINTNSAANMQLQTRLASYGLYTWPIDRSYGPRTQQAVKDYQRLKGIPETGTVGPITRQSLNDDVGNITGQTKSKLDLWCEIAIKIEDADPKNHNQFNIRYIGQKEAIGKSKSGFCIFPDDATGYKMGRDLFIRAASGGSKLYNPEGSLYDFYEVFAPSKDKNNPRQYAESVAHYIGVDPNVSIKTLLN